MNHKCLTCGAGVFLNHGATSLCRGCAKEESPLAVPLYCLDCCRRENKCANCGSEVQKTRREQSAK